MADAGTVPALRGAGDGGYAEARVWAVDGAAGPEPEDACAADGAVCVAGRSAGGVAGGVGVWGADVPVRVSVRPGCLGGPVVRGVFAGGVGAVSAVIPAQVGHWVSSQV